MPSIRECRGRAERYRMVVAAMCSNVQQSVALSRGVQQCAAIGSNVQHFMFRTDCYKHR